MKKEQILYIDKRTKNAEIYLIILLNHGISGYEVAKKFYNKERLKVSQGAAVSGYINNLKKLGLITQTKEQTGRKKAKICARIEPLLDYYPKFKAENLITLPPKGLTNNDFRTFVIENRERIFTESAFYAFKINKRNSVLLQIMNFLYQLQRPLSCLNLPGGLAELEELDKLLKKEGLTAEILKTYAEYQLEYMIICKGYAEYQLVKNKILLRIYNHLERLKKDKKFREFYEANETIEKTIKLWDNVVYAKKLRDLASINKVEDLIERMKII